MSIYTSIQTGYEKIAESFSQTRQNFWRDLSFIKEYIKENNKILDFGCGNGRLIELIKNKKVTYLGIDVCQKFIKIARKKYPQHKFELIKLNTDFSLKHKEEFDSIFCIGVFHHFPKEQSRKIILQRLKKSLKPNGFLIMTVWDLDRLKYKKYLPESNEGYVPFKNNQGEIIFNRYCYHWKLAELKDFITTAGFKIIKAGHTRRNDQPANLYCIAQK
jgi:2-polyprenyl-3-methyl-5-hydroxy-6-metoxy-1,4-benzoquinol methylase